VYTLDTQDYHELVNPSLPEMEVTSSDNDPEIPENGE